MAEKLEDDDALQNVSESAPGDEPKRKGFAKVLGSIWKTTQTSDVEGDQELLIRRTFRELVIYMFFLILVCIIAFGSISINMFYYTKVMMTLFLDSHGSGGQTFKDITTTEDFWTYLKGPLLDGLYWDKWYNGMPLPEDTDGFIYYENKLLGVPRFRQIRVQGNSCHVNEEFQSFIKDCYSEYSYRNEDTKPFGLHATNKNSTEWFYKTEDETHEFPYWGKLHYYGGGGFIKDLDAKRSVSEDIIKDLEHNLWIQRGTRAVIISFTVYNANINLFCVIILTVEFPSTGGAIPGWTFNSLKFIRYSTSFDLFIFVIEILFCVYIVYYLIEEIFEISVNGVGYFKDAWNILDVTLIVFSALCIGFSIYRNTYIDQTLEEMIQAPHSHASKFQYLAFSEFSYNNMLAVSVFTAWVKVFKYISFNKTMTQLSTTLSRCAKDLLGFFIMFFIVFLAFTQLGYLLFGTQVEEFSTFMNSFFTLFRIILGDFDFFQLEQANRILGPIYFMIFVFFVFFVLINMFLAIINDTYSEVKSDMAKQTDQFIMSDFIKQNYHKFWDKYIGAKAVRIEGIEGVLQKGAPMHYDQWKIELKKMGFKDQEIEDVFKKYDVDQNHILDAKEQKEMLQDLQQMKLTVQEREGVETARFDGEDVDEEEDLPAIVVDKEEAQSVAVDEFAILSRRVDRMEASIRAVVKNIDTVLETISNLK